MDSSTTEKSPLLPHSPTAQAEGGRVVVTLKTQWKTFGFEQHIYIQVYDYLAWEITNVNSRGNHSY